MVDLLRELNWKVTSTDVGGSYDKKWFGKIKSTIENLLFLQDEGWRDEKINIQADLCNKLNIPDWFIRFTVGYITDDFPSVKKRFDMES